MATRDAAAWWAAELARWGIPPEILDQAPSSPWEHAPGRFRPGAAAVIDTPSRRRALEALASAGPAASVLDVGCGGGRATFALTPPARSVVGVDRNADMLEVFAGAAAERGVAARTVLGTWPDVAAHVATCDVVVCHHVLFDVAALAPFVQTLTAHATRRVVVEVTTLHPLADLAAAWQHFWGLTRPASPTSGDALEVVRATGVDARAETFTVPDDRGELTAERVARARRRLCLPALRDAEVREVLAAQPARPRQLTTIWWPPDP